MKTNSVHELPEGSTDVPKHVVVKDCTFEFLIYALNLFYMRLLG